MAQTSVVSYYNKKAKYYDVFNIHTRRLTYIDIKSFIKIFDIFKLKPKIILDVGCGTGRLSNSLAKHGYGVVGIDISKESIKIAKMKANSKKVKFIVSDVLEYKSAAKFDCVVAGDDVIGHFITDKMALKCFIKIYKMLRGGGIFIFDSANPNSKKTYPHVKKWTAKLNGVTIRAERKSKMTNGIYLWSDHLDINDNGSKILMSVKNRIKVRAPGELDSLLRIAGFNVVGYYPAITQKGKPRIFYYVARKD